MTEKGRCRVLLFAEGTLELWAIFFAPFTVFRVCQWGDVNCSLSKKERIYSVYNTCKCSKYLSFPSIIWSPCTTLIISLNVNYIFRNRVNPGQFSCSHFRTRLWRQRAQKPNHSPACRVYTVHICIQLQHTQFSRLHLPSCPFFLFYFFLVWQRSKKLSRKNRNTCLELLTTK